MRRLTAALIMATTLAFTAAPAGAVSTADKAHKIMKTLYGPCFKSIYTGNLKKVSVVKLSTETRGVLTVSVYLKRISTGQDLQYDFRVNTGTKFAGPPGPGTGIPVNTTARALVAGCP